MKLAPRSILPEFAPGSVWLAGAGPGDPGLLTLDAAHALEMADVVLHDALVAPEILSLAATPWLEPVGKRAGGKRTPQLQINQRLITLARQGKRVLRLKGGDPLIFGRGGEEALALAAAGIPFRIIPGVTAGLAAAASAGIPLTHRTLARSVAFATGHDARGGFPDSIDVAALASGADVLVFYMALRQADTLVRRLMQAGRAPDEAVAFVSNASTARQLVHETTLAGAAQSAASLDQHAPTLIVVGPVVALRRMMAPMLAAAPARISAPLSAAGSLR